MELKTYNSTDTGVTTVAKLSSNYVLIKYLNGVTINSTLVAAIGSPDFNLVSSENP
jgi:hypothetical protein